MNIIERSAIISEDGFHRYRLERKLDSGNPLALAALMVNPSKADADRDDPTIRRWYGFADRLGYGRIIVGNKFSWRATDVKELAHHAAYAAGSPENDRHLEQIMRDADLHIVGWGPLAKLPGVLRGRWREVVRIADRVGCPLYCLGTAQDGHPRHPLMLPSDATLVKWEVPWFANRSAA